MNNDTTSANESPRPEDGHTQASFAGEEWMTIEQVAEHFGCLATRVRQWIADGILTTQASGSIEMIQRRELDRVGNPDEGGAKEFQAQHPAQSAAE